jgi:GNAT superfamily N-acetyltransferase
MMIPNHIWGKLGKIIEAHMKTKLIPFTKEMIPEAGTLLAKRHQRNRRVFRFLPARFEKPGVSAKALEELMEKKTTSGYAALRNGKLIAYLIGDHTVEPWGRCGWNRLPGNALADGESVTILQDLYVLLGDDWVNKGVFIHHTYFSAADEDLVAAWFNLDFGKERIDAVLDFNQMEVPEIQIPSGIQIRPAGAGDNELLAGMSHIISRELAKPPYWHPTPPEVRDDLREGWAEIADDTTMIAWLAIENEQALGMIGFYEQEQSNADMLAVPKMSYLTVAATREEARGRGIATALTWTGLAHCKQNEDNYCITNWISPNLAASRFWPRFGFEDVAYRLTKNINPMIAWTRKMQHRLS